MKSLWISTAARLPEAGERVLVFAPLHGYSIKPATWWASNKVWTTDRNVAMPPIEITHWQPLIAPERVA